MATHSSILAWEIPRTGETGGLQSMGLQRVRPNWAMDAHTALSGEWTSERENPPHPHLDRMEKEWGKKGNWGESLAVMDRVWGGGTVWKVGALLDAAQDPNRVRSVQSLGRVWLFATPWTAALQASLTIANSGHLLKFMSIELVIHLTISSSSTPSPPDRIHWFSTKRKAGNHTTKPCSETVSNTPEWHPSQGESCWPLYYYLRMMQCYRIATHYFGKCTVFVEWLSQVK